MLNEVTLIGNLGADPEVRNTKSGTAVTNLRVATTERRKGADGNWVDHTEWHRVVLFGKAAENAMKYLKKGRQVFIRGKLRTSKFTDKEGVERFSTDVVGDDIKFLGGNGDRREGNQERVENWDAKPAAAGTKNENWAAAGTKNENWAAAGTKNENWAAEDEIGPGQNAFNDIPF